MSSFLLFFIIGAIFYLLTKGFIKNPQINKINMEHKQQVKGDLKDHEAGLLIALMAKVAKADGRVSELEAELIKLTLTDISNAFHGSEKVREELKSIYSKEKEFFENTIVIAQKYLSITKYEYKKRLSVMEYLLNLSFIDGHYSETEKMITEDIANALEIKKADFDILIARFEEYYAQQKAHKQMNLEEAYKTLGVSQSDDFQTIKKQYRSLVKKNHPDILMGQGKEQNIIDQATAKLQKINEAYELIKSQKSN